MTLQTASTKSTTTTGTTSHVVTNKQPLTSSPVITQQKTTQMPTTPTPQTSTTRITQLQTTQASSSSSYSSLSSTKSLTTSSNPSCQGAIQCILSCPNGFFIDPIPAPDGCPRCFCKTGRPYIIVHAQCTQSHLIGPFRQRSEKHFDIFTMDVMILNYLV